MFCVGILSPALASDPVPVESIVLEPAAAVISVGKTLTVKASVTPKNASARQPVWSSSDESVATVLNGKVKGIAPGTATITAKAADESGITASMEITVVIPAKKVTAAEPELILAPETTWLPEVHIEPEEATIRTLAWTSSNEDVATVDENGVISAVAAGRCKIVCTAKDDSKVKTAISVQVMKHDVVMLTPDEVRVDFPTRDREEGVVPRFRLGANADDGDDDDEEDDAGDEDEDDDEDDDEDEDDSYDDDDEEDDDEDDYDDEDDEDEDDEDDDDDDEDDEDEVTDSVTVTFLNGLVSEGSAEYTLRALKPGSETVEVVTRRNKKVTGRAAYTVFVAQSAILLESDDEIGRLEAESYAGHTYQIFYSSRSWDNAEAFCEKHGGHLATVTGVNEQKFLERYLAKTEKKESYWIGLNSAERRRFSQWTTDEIVTYTKWMDGNPDMNQPYSCVRIAAGNFTDPDGVYMKRGTWADDDMYYYRIAGFICEWEEENSPNALPPLNTP